MSVLGILKQKYSQYPIQVLENGEYFEFIIINSDGRDNISVDNKSGIDQTELTFRFSYQHAHFGADINALIQYIDDFLSDSKAAIEFFRYGKNVRGGSVSLAETDSMSPDELARLFGHTSSNILGETYKVRTWSGKKDMDAEVVMKNGQIVCREKSAL